MAFWIRGMVLLVIMVQACLLTAQKISVDSVKNLILTRPDDTLKVIHYRMVSGLLQQTNPVEGIGFAKAGVALGKKLGFDKGTAGCFLNMSVLYGTLRKLDTAIVYMDSTILFAYKAGDPNRLALAYLNRGDAYMQLQNFDKALKDCDSSLVYAERANNDDRRARIFQTFGSVYLYQELYPRAIEYYVRADSLYHKKGNLLMSAIIQNNLSIAYKAMGDYQKSVNVMHKAIAIADSLKEVTNLSMYHSNLSDGYFHLNELALAEKHALISMNYAVQFDTKLYIANAWQNLGQVYMKQNKKEKGIEAFTKSYEISKEINDLLKIETSTLDLAEAYASMGNHLKAFEFLKISTEAGDSLAVKRYKEDIASMQTRFEVGEKDKEIQLLNKDNDIQQARLSRQRVLFLSSVGLIIMGLIGISLYISRYRLKNRMKELELRQRIAADLHDEVGSSISSIHMLSQIALQKQESANGNEILQRMSRHAKETMDKMSDIVWMIKPGESEGISLKQRIEQFAYEIANTQQINITTDLDTLEKEKLNMEQRRNIYLIFKEAINNALKYSGTEKLDILASTKDGNLQLLIRDYGTGMDLHHQRRGNGLGNMEKRAKEIGGRLIIESAPGQGTSIELVSPL